MSADGLQLTGADLEVLGPDGLARRLIQLDHAATTPALAGVVAAIEQLLPWYGSVERGTGRTCEVSTAALAGARAAVHEFVGGGDDHVAVFVRNATEGINLLSTLLPAGSRVLSTPFEHHANMLPWRARHEVQLLPFVPGPEQLVGAVEEALAQARGAIRLVAVTGASNVTGELWPVAELAEVAHAHGAELLVDAAQLAPHRQIAMAATGVDHLVLSGHKLYAPFGAGALLARRELLATSLPMLRGGGAVEAVTLDDVRWTDAPRRHEAGTPNLVGAVALGVACDLLAAETMAAVAEHERPLAARLRAGLDALPGVQRLLAWPEGAAEQVATTSFVVADRSAELLAAALGHEHAISVRGGRFCAHPFLGELNRRVGRRADAGALRASLGVASTAADVDAFLEALGELIEDGPRLAYDRDPHSRRLVPDEPAPLPVLPFRLGGERTAVAPA